MIILTAVLTILGMGGMLFSAITCIEFENKSKPVIPVLICVISCLIFLVSILVYISLLISEQGGK